MCLVKGRDQVFGRGRGKGLFRNVGEDVFGFFHLMEDAPPDLVPSGIEMDDEEGNIISIGLHAPGDDVSQARSRCDNDYTDPVGYFRKTAGCKGQVSFMPSYKNVDIL